jgi:20S proteasome subunit beta 5
MNTFVNRFSTTGPTSELLKARASAEDGEFSDAMWGSEAGFGSLAHGVPTFPLPAVADVSHSPCEHV